MKIKCDNADNGCEWISELHLLDKHLIGCDYTLLPCPNECEGGDKILCKDMERHKREECPRREYVCPHCEGSGEYIEQTTTHLEECPLMEIPCTNDGCSEHVVRHAIHKHFMECQYQMVSCRHACIGCKIKVLRKDLKKHEGDREQHLDLAINAVSKHEDTLYYFDLSYLQDDVARIDDAIDILQEFVKHHTSTLARLQNIILAQNKEISELKLKLERQAIAPPHFHWNIPDPVPIQDLTVFKFTDYSQRKSCDASVFSPPIYSSPGGYKLCINVVPNGDGKGKGTHTSVFTYLMRGESDDHLPWPFTGTVVIELLNQLADRKHHSTSTKMSKDHDTSQRVWYGDKAKNGYGHPCYIAHSSLEYNAAKKCQYLKDDCLYFRIKINSDVTPKPWLSPTDVL